jgi:predicted alpha/beta hydrolase family esterase
VLGTLQRTQDLPAAIFSSSSRAARPWEGLAARPANGLVELGALDHINGKSGLGKWQESLNLRHAFKAGLMRA